MLWQSPLVNKVGSAFVNGRARSESEVKIFTVGHSTRTIEEFLELLHGHGVQAIADVRTIPKSRHNPQFGEGLGESLRADDIDYAHFRSLGGLRRSTDNDVNGAWRNSSFRGYADHMQTDEFEDGINGLRAMAAQCRTAIMCAEALPWRCHRSLIGDALVVRGDDVLDIMSTRGVKPHTLTSFAHVDGTRLTYP